MTTRDYYAKLHRSFSRHLDIDIPTSVSSWADNNRYLSLASSSEPGRWRTSRTPYLREIMDNISPSSIKKIIVMKGHQIGYTEGILMNGLAYVISTNPAPTLFVAPSDKEGKKMLQQKIEPMINDTPTVRSRIARVARMHQRNNLIHKDFPGGFLAIAGANVPSDLASTSVRNLFLDEVDRMPSDVSGEGSPIELAIARTASYSRKKIIMGSTPVSEETSIIFKYFKEGDQRYYYIPCPHCGHMQVLDFANFNCEDLRDIFYECEKCHEKIHEHHKAKFLPLGEWRPTADSLDPSTRSYHLNSLYSPLGFLSWKDVALASYKAKGDEVFHQTFQNLYLGIPTALGADDHPKPTTLELRTHTYERNHPPSEDFMVNTMGVDVQKDRVEVLLSKFHQQVWYVKDHLVFYGDSNSDIEEKDSPWFGLKELLLSESVHMCHIDCGYLPHRVFDWVKYSDLPFRIRAVRGTADFGNIISLKKHMGISIAGHKRARSGDCYYDTNTHLLKQEIYKRLLIDDSSSSSYIHFPKDLGTEFYEQLCSERQLLNKDNPNDVTYFPKYKWIKIRTRNEVLDLMVYCLGAWYSCEAPEFLDRWSLFQKIMTRSLR